MTPAPVATTAAHSSVGEATVQVFHEANKFTDLFALKKIAPALASRRRACSTDPSTSLRARPATLSVHQSTQTFAAYAGRQFA